MKDLPRYIVKKIEQAQAYAEKVDAIDAEIKEWLEKNGVEDASDAMYQNSNPRYVCANYEDDIRRIYQESQED